MRSMKIGYKSRFKDSVETDLQRGQGALGRAASDAEPMEFTVKRCGGEELD